MVVASAEFVVIAALLSVVDCSLERTSVPRPISTSFSFRPPFMFFQIRSCLSKRDAQRMMMPTPTMTIGQRRAGRMMKIMGR